MRSCGLAIILAFLAAPVAGAASAPNFVFMFADDQRHDAMGVVQREQGAKGRFPWFKTPNMDRLAAEGVRFRNAFVVNSLCSPSRACFLSGKYSHSNGVWNNRTPLDAALKTHASILKSNGYSTGYVGKWHMGPSQSERPGFEWYASFKGQSTHFNATFLVNGTPEKTAEWTDDRSAAYAIRFLEKDRAKDKPFVLVIGFKAPHGPTQPPKRLENAFAGEVARPVPSLGVRPGFNTDASAPMRFGNGQEPPLNLNYFRCIAGVDENVGKILDTLDRLKLSDNTVVVYSSDNGFYLGEHMLADKRSGYEESLRIPMLVRHPGAKARGVVRDDMVLNIDLAPTFLDIAGQVPPVDMHGKSWKGLLAGEPQAKPFRESFFYEYFREGGQAGAARSLGGFNTPTMTALRTANRKLLKYRDHPEWTEMFDLSADPFELRNLARDPARATELAALEKEHGRLSRELGYRIPDNVPPETKP